MAVSIDLIKQFPFFQGLPDLDLQAIAQNAQLGAAKQNQEILARGSLVSFLTFVVSGRIQSTEIADDGRVIGITILVPGDIIGCLTLADGQPVTNTLRTLEDSQMLLVPMALAKNLLVTQPIVAQRVLHLLAQSVRHSIKERSMLSLPNAFHRIFVQLNLLVNNNAAERQIQHVPRQQDIAAMVNTSRETVSRALQLLIKNGVLTKTGHQLHIQQSDALKKLAADGLDALPVTKE
jgi:CRP/FNR family transcriptional regulator, cyclic AMP receptor protein